MNTLTAQQWKLIKPLLPKQNFKKGGRPRKNDRRTLNGILWVLRTGAQWSEIPRRYGYPTTCWRRLKVWQELGVWEKIWKALLGTLHKRDKIDWAVAFLDGSFVPAKKGVPKLASHLKAKAQN